MVNREHAQRLWNNLLELGPRRLTVLALVGLVVFLGVGGGAYYLSRPEFEILYTGLNREDITRVSAVLRDANISFDVNAAGDTVYVHPGQTAQARTLLADKGLPNSSSGGYELFDKIGSLGLTSFMQEITRVRALEGEIARTIQVLKGVKAARVHIVMAARGSFRREQLPPSASVVLRTDGPADARTARSVRHLVAAAVPGMTPDKVTVLDSDGSLLSSDDEGTTPATMANLQRVVSRLIQENVSKALTPYLGLDNFEVSVATQLSTDKRQTNETVYDPESRVQRSVRAVREKETSQSADKQTPTTVQQNLPDQQINAGGGKNTNDEKNRCEDVTNYEVSSKTTTTVSDGYLVNKLFLAVLVNRPRLIASLGDKASEAAVEAKVAEIAQLAATAAGIDRTARGPDPGLRGRVHGRRARLSAGPVDHLHGSADAPVGQLRQRRHHPCRGSDADLVRIAASDQHDPRLQGNRDCRARSRAGRRPAGRRGWCHVPAFVRGAAQSRERHHQKSAERSATAAGADRSAR